MSNKKIKITLIGNCQTKALTWYIQQLSSSFDVKWVAYSSEPLHFSKTNYFKKRKTPTILNNAWGIKRLEDSDYVIFQHIKKETSPKFHFENIKKYAKNAKLISISSMIYDPDDPEEKFLKGMIKRAEIFNIDIPAHKIVNKCKGRIKMREDEGLPRHPSVIYFLELVREICVKAEWSFYSEKKYQKYLKEKYPFG